MEFFLVKFFYTYHYLLPAYFIGKQYRIKEFFSKSVNLEEMTRGLGLDYGQNG